MTKKIDFDAIKKAASSSPIMQTVQEDDETPFKKIIEYKLSWQEKIEALLKSRGEKSPNVSAFIREAIREKLIREEVEI